jgi:hypothetical protein
MSTEKQREYWRNHHKQYRKDHPDYVKKCHEYEHNYRKNESIKLKNNDRLRAYRKTEKYKLYKIQYREQRRLQQREKRKDPIFRLANNMSRCMYESLISQGLSKRNRHWETLVGYTLVDLKTHLEKQFTPEMNWNNYGKYWHIDHIIPRSFFKYDSLESDEFKKCWSLTNLRPLYWIDNLSKGNRLSSPLPKCD